MSTLTMSIDGAWLNGLDACDDEYAMFCEEWPDGADVSKENLDRAAVLGMNIGWFARNVLPKVVFDECNKKCYLISDEFELSRKMVCKQYFLLRNEYYVEFSRKRIECSSMFNADFRTFETTYNANIAALLIRYQDDLVPFKNEYTSKCNALFITCISDYYRDRGYVL